MRVERGRSARPKGRATARPSMRACVGTTRALPEAKALAAPNPVTLAVSLAALDLPVPLARSLHVYRGLSLCGT